jgi:hypothetical protein
MCGVSAGDRPHGLVRIGIALRFGLPVVWKKDRIAAWTAAAAQDAAPRPYG